MICGAIAVPVDATAENSAVAMESEKKKDLKDSEDRKTEDEKRERRVKINADHVAMPRPYVPPEVTVVDLVAAEEKSKETKAERKAAKKARKNAREATKEKARIAEVEAARIAEVEAVQKDERKAARRAERRAAKKEKDAADAGWKSLEEDAKRMVQAKAAEVEEEDVAEKGGAEKGGADEMGKDAVDEGVMKEAALEKGVGVEKDADDEMEVDEEEEVEKTAADEVVETVSKDKLEDTCEDEVEKASATEVEKAGAEGVEKEDEDEEDAAAEVEEDAEGESMVIEDEDEEEAAYHGTTEAGEVDIDGDSDTEAAGDAAVEVGMGAVGKASQLDGAGVTEAAKKDALEDASAGGDASPVGDFGAASGAAGAAIEGAAEEEDFAEVLEKLREDCKTARKVCKDAGDELCRAGWVHMVECCSIKEKIIAEEAIGVASKKKVRAWLLCADTEYALKKKLAEKKKSESAGDETVAGVGEDEDFDAFSMPEKKEALGELHESEEEKEARKRRELARAGGRENASDADEMEAGSESDEVLEEEVDEKKKVAAMEEDKVNEGGKEAVEKEVEAPVTEEQRADGEDISRLVEEYDQGFCLTHKKKCFAKAGGGGNSVLSSRWR